jgi:hypothetical protein
LSAIRSASVWPPAYIFPDSADRRILAPNPKLLWFPADPHFELSVAHLLIFLRQDDAETTT